MKAKTTPVTTLEFRQLVTLKPAGMVKRFKNYYENVQDMAYLLQCAVLVLVKNAFSPLNYSFLAQEQICDILLTADVNELASVRHLCVYFEEFFSPEDWQKVIDRLFINQEEYLQVTASTRAHAHLHNYLHCGERQPEKLMNIATVFKDANGKNHRFTLKDVDPCYTIEETTELLSIITTLTIFEKDGVRRFTQLFRYFYAPTEPVFDAEVEKQKAEEARLLESLQAQLTQALDYFAQLTVSDEPDAGFLMQSEDYVANNRYGGKTPEEIADLMFEDFQPKPEMDEQEMLSRMLTALTGGIKLTEAKPLFDLSKPETAETPAPEDPPKKPRPDKSRNKNRQPNDRKGKQGGSFNKEEILEERKQKRWDQFVRKVTGKKKRGKKKR